MDSAEIPTTPTVPDSAKAAEAPVAPIEGDAVNTAVEPKTAPAPPVTEAGPEPEAPAVAEWRKTRTERQKALDTFVDGSVTVAVELADKGFLEGTTKGQVDNAFKIAQWVDRVDPKNDYNPQTGEFTGPDGKPDKFTTYQKVLLDLVHAAAGSETVDPQLKTLAQEVNRVLWPRKVEEKGGYTFYTGEVRESVILTEHYCLPLLRRIEEAFVARKLDRSRDPQNQEAYLQIINEMRMLLNQNSGLDFDTKLQLVNELLNNQQVQKVLPLIPAVDARYKDQNDRVQGKVMPTQDLVAELRIKYDEVTGTGVGKKNLVADWLVNEMKALGINVDDVQKQAISQKTGLEVLTKLEKAGFENWANSTGFINKIRGSIFGGAGIDLDIQSLKDLAKNKDALAIISKKFVGTSEKLSEIFGEEKMKILGRLPKKLPLEQYAMYFMILYGMLGPSIFEGLGEGGSEATSAQAAA